MVAEEWPSTEKTCFGRIIGYSLPGIRSRICNDWQDQGEVWGLGIFFVSDSCSTYKPTQEGGIYIGKQLTNGGEEKRTVEALSVLPYLFLCLGQSSVP